MEKYFIIIAVIILNVVFGIFKNKKKDKGKNARSAFSSFMEGLIKKYIPDSENFPLSGILGNNEPSASSLTQEDNVREAGERGTIGPEKATEFAEPFLFEEQPVQKSAVRIGFNMKHSDLKRGIILSEILSPCLAKRKSRKI